LTRPKEDRESIPVANKTQNAVPKYPIPIPTSSKNRTGYPQLQPSSKLPLVQEPSHAVGDTRNEVEGTQWETFTLPNEAYLYDPRKTALEAEKDLRNLMEGTFDVQGDTAINEEQRKVKGFREEISLLDHQVLGRTWMAARESGKKFGGILADDMGCVSAYLRVSTKQC
jgi:hypothetical protein